ncbi:hypothetical protein K1719_004230 [Acacia pycnantha]|nr:hypothetical protein K1719_004230 [Acacia pycnantha]
MKENLKVILEEKVAVLQVYWGECSRELVTEVHSAGVKIVPQVGSVEATKKAIKAGNKAINIYLSINMVHWNIEIAHRLSRMKGHKQGHDWHLLQ